MQIIVAGKGVDTGDALKSHVADGLEAVAKKYFDRALEAHVTFRKDRSFFTCDINLHAGRGLTMRAEGEGADAHRAFADATDHIAKRLRRHRRRVNDHSRGVADEREAVTEAARDVVLRTPDDDEDATPLEGATDAVVAETPTRINRLSVNEAVARLDLSGAPVLMFRNAGTGMLNVVYRRADGHVGWIDPQGA